MDSSKSASSKKPSAPRSLRIGTSGFSYDDWVGAYYPSGTKRSGFFDYYVQDFDCLEINVSYYTWLSKRAVENLVSRAPVGFRFAAKLHRSLTHETGPDLERGIWATGEQNKPFGESPVLLAQFPNRFAPTDGNWTRILKMAASLSPLVVEFRNSKWQEGSVVERLAAEKISVCIVDQPRLPGLLRFIPELTGELAYVRFHGRNAKKWYGHEKAYERYDYRYDGEELKEVGEPIVVLSERAKETLVFFNNHYGAQAVDNARELAALLGVGMKPQQGKLY